MKRHSISIRFSSGATVLSALEEALADHDVTVKSYAIQVLAERGGKYAIEALRQALRDPDVSMKKIIIEKVAPAILILV